MSSNYTGVITKSYKPRTQTLKDDLRARRNKDFFKATGTQVYVGRQGSGKTISAIKHMIDLKNQYMKSIVVSNVGLTVLKPRRFKNKYDLKELLSTIDKTKEYIYFQSMAELEIALVGVNNGYYGVMYLVDEIHTYFNALESKNIPMYVFTEISQQRKQRKLIIGTSQLFMRMAKPFREQCDNMIDCRTLMGVLTIQKAFDGMTVEADDNGKLKGGHRKTGWFFHTRRIRKAYNTYQKVVSGELQFEQTQKVKLEVGKKGVKVK